MRSIDKLALTSAIFGGMALIWSITWLGFTLTYKGGASGRVVQLVVMTGFFVPPVLGLVGVSLGRKALRRPDINSVEPRGCTMARVGIALGICGVCPLLLVCLLLTIGLATGGLGIFGH